MKTLSATEASRHFSEILDQVRHDGESFVIVRRGEEVARLTPVGEGRKGASLRDLLRLIEEAGPRDPSFADDLEAIQAAQPVQHEGSWDS